MTHCAEVAPGRWAGCGAPLRPRMARKREGGVTQPIHLLPHQPAHRPSGQQLCPAVGTPALSFLPRQGNTVSRPPGKGATWETLLLNAPGGPVFLHMTSPLVAEMGEPLARREPGRRKDRVGWLEWLALVSDSMPAGVSELLSAQSEGLRKAVQAVSGP